MKAFFPMRGSEVVALTFLILFSVVSFMSRWRTIEIAGMAAFGWFMAALMVISPAVALFVFLRERRS